MSDVFGTGDVGSAVQPCPTQPKPSGIYWIALEMVGEDDQPIPWEEYEVTLPGGEKVRGFLDGLGLARIDNIDTAGTCRIAFPALDQEAWMTANDVPPGRTSDAL